MFARSALAQRPAAVQASAYVIDSFIATMFRTDSTTATVAATHAPAQAAPRQVRIAGLGVLDIRSGPATEIRVASRSADARGTSGSTIQVSVSYLGN